MQDSKLRRIFAKKGRKHPLFSKSIIIIIVPLQNKLIKTELTDN